MLPGNATFPWAPSNAKTASGPCAPCSQWLQASLLLGAIQQRSLQDAAELAGGLQTRCRLLRFIARTCVCYFLTIAIPHGGAGAAYGV